MNILLFIICLSQCLIIGYLLFFIKRIKVTEPEPYKLKKVLDVEDINPTLLNDVIESSKIEEWNNDVKVTSSYPYITWEVESINPQKTLKIKTILRDYGDSPKVGYFLLTNLEKDESISFNSNKVEQKQILLNYVWDIVVKDHENKVDKINKDYKNKIDNITKHLKTLNRERSLKKLLNF
jgi:hypothetical protein